VSTTENTGNSTSTTGTTSTTSMIGTIGTSPSGSEGTGRAGSPTGATGKASSVSQRRPAPAQDVSVTVQVWGPQRYQVRASSGGGRGGRPYVAVTVGACLTYVYDAAALATFLAAWTRAEQANRSVRLPDFAPPSRTRGNLAPPGQQPDPEDLAVVHTVQADLVHSVLVDTDDLGRPVLTVTVGAVRVQVHTTTALRSDLAAWTQAGTVRVLLPDSRDEQD